MANQYIPRFLSDTQKECSNCSEIKLHSSFHKDKNSPSGLAYYCKECANRKSRELNTRRRNDFVYRQAKRSDYFNHKYGLTLQEYTERLKAQGSICAICKVELPTSGPKTHLDHCHKTGKLRAFLCTNCNRGLGHFQESPDLLASAISYLKTHTSNVEDMKGVIL